MGCAHEGAAISSTTSTATWTRAAGLGGGGLESTTACWVNEVPKPVGAALGSSSGVFESAAAVPGPGSTVALWSYLPKSPYRLPGLWSRIQRLREEPAQKWSLILVKA